MTSCTADDDGEEVGADEWRVCAFLKSGRLWCGSYESRADAEKREAKLGHGALRDCDTWIERRGEALN